MRKMPNLIWYQAAGLKDTSVFKPCLSSCFLLLSPLVPCGFRGVLLPFPPDTLPFASSSLCLFSLSLLPSPHDACLSLAFRGPSPLWDALWKERKEREGRG